MRSHGDRVNESPIPVGIIDATSIVDHIDVHGWSDIAHLSIGGTSGKILNVPDGVVSFSVRNDLSL
jgi:hypothetical protein